MDYKTVELLMSKLTERQTEFKQVLCDGGAKSYDHYKELSGTIRGLQLAQLEINDLARKLKDSEDD